MDAPLTLPELQAPDRLTQWLTDGVNIKTRFLGLQNGLFGGEDKMIEVSHGRSVIVLSETEFAAISAKYTAGHQGESLRGIQSPMAFGEGFWLQGDPEVQA